MKKRQQFPVRSRVAPKSQSDALKAATMAAHAALGDPSASVAVVVSWPLGEHGAAVHAGMAFGTSPDTMAHLVERGPKMLQEFIDERLAGQMAEAVAPPAKA